MNITLRQLRYFVEIANSRSFSRASEHLNVVQPALSQNISALETDLGVALFKRHARGVSLSDAGQLLLAEAIELIARIDALKDRVGSREVRPSGMVRLSIAGSLARVLAGPLLRKIAVDYPDIELMVKEGLSSEVRRQVESGHAHLAVMPSPSELQSVASVPIFEESFMLFGARAAMRRFPAEITFAQLSKLPLAEPDRAHDLRKILERVADATQNTVDVRYELNSPALLVSVVQEGLAFSVMPPSSCQDAVDAKAIVGRRVVEPELTRVQAIVWPCDRPLGLAATVVRDTVFEVAHGLIEQGTLKGRIAQREL